MSDRTRQRQHTETTGEEEQDEGVDETDEDGPTDVLIDRNTPVIEADEAVIDRQPGSGSLTRQEAYIEANSRPIEHDGRALTRTTFYQMDGAESGPSQRHRDHAKRRSWEQLAKVNDGMYSDGQSSRVFEADKRRWVRTFTSQLECTPAQTEQTMHLVEMMDMRPFVGARTSSEKVILGCISLVVDTDTREFENWIVNRDDFRDLMDDVGMDMDELWSTRELIRDQTEMFS